MRKLKLFVCISFTNGLIGKIHMDNINRKYIGTQDIFLNYLCRQQANVWLIRFAWLVKERHS